LIRGILQWIVNRAESQYNVERDRIVVISREHMYDINATASRNWWYDKRGNKWPLRDSL